MRMLTVLPVLLSIPFVGQSAVTWSFSGSIPADKQTAITSAMNTAVANYNLYANFTANIVVTYNAGVPTAQTDGYMGLIEFGGSISARVAQHEMGHYFGCGTYGDWNAHRSNGQWTGANAIAKLASYDGTGAILYADTIHFWPYGWNYDNEGPADRNIGMVCALRQDMGLSSGTRSNPIPNGTYRIISRNSGKALDVNGASTTDGATVRQWPFAGTGNQVWELTQLGNGVYRIVGVQSGKALSVFGASTADGASTGIWTWGNANHQKWFIQPAVLGGYYKLINVNSGKALDVTGGSTNDGAVVFQWSENSGYNQQWAIQSVPISPPNMVLASSNGMLTLSWTAGQIAWRLEAQTNSWDGGLGTNWYPVSGLSTTNPVSIPLDQINGSVFFRLRFP